MEDASKIVDEFKKRDALMNSALDQDRQKQFNSLQDKLKNRRKKINTEIDE